MPLDGCPPVLEEDSTFYRVTCTIRVRARSLNEAQSIAAFSVENWDTESGWKHLSGDNIPEGYVMVLREDS